MVERIHVDRTVVVREVLGKFDSRRHHRHVGDKLSQSTTFSASVLCSSMSSRHWYHQIYCSYLQILICSTSVPRDPPLYGRNASEIIATSPAGAVASIWWKRLCVCLCVCLSVCLSVYLSVRISPKPHARSLPNFCVCSLWPLLGPPPASLR